MSSDAARGMAFPREEFDQRVQRTREGLRARGLDAGIFAAAESLYYLIGYESPSHFGFQLLVLPVEQEPFVVIRQHMASGVRAESWLQDIVTFPDTEDPIETTRQALADRKLAGRRLAFEETAPPLTLQTARRLEAALGGVQLGDCSGIVEALRLVKSPREIEYVRQAARVSDIGMETARRMVRLGVSEIEIAAEATRDMLLSGGKYQAEPLLGDGTGVVLIQSLFEEFGSGVWVEGGGFALQNRMCGFTLESGHPNEVGPGKRPLPHALLQRGVAGRSPGACLRDAGGHAQTQTLVQVLNNLVVFGMDVQEAVEAPRFTHEPGRLLLEARVPSGVRTALARRGHPAAVLPGWSSLVGGAGAVAIHPESGVRQAGADSRRDSYAVPA